MPPVPELIGRAVHFNHFGKLGDTSRQPWEDWPFWTVVFASIFAAILVVITTRFCLRGKHRDPRQTAFTEKTNTENVGHPDMVEEHRSDGWTAFILACHAAVTLSGV